MDLAKLVTALTGSGSQLLFEPARAGELSRSALDCDRAARDLNWRPATSLTTGVQAVIRWFEAGAPDRAAR